MKKGMLNSKEQPTSKAMIICTFVYTISGVRKDHWRGRGGFWVPVFWGEGLLVLKFSVGLWPSLGKTSRKSN